MSIIGTGLSISIGPRAILDDVSIQIGAGEVVSVLGPNGAGKSTLLKTLCGDLKPAGGEVTMNGRPLFQWSPKERARRRAVLPQQTILSFAFSAMEVVLMGRTPHAMGKLTPKDYEAARAALAEADAAHLESRIYTTLSGGERQRVHLARVLAQMWDASSDEGFYLLFDEPLAGLDLSHQHHTLAVARRFAAKGAGVLVILHDLNLAAQYSDRIVVLRRGEVVGAGTPHAVLRPDLIEEVFGLRTLVLPHPSLDCPLVVAGTPHDMGAM